MMKLLFLYKKLLNLIQFSAKEIIRKWNINHYITETDIQEIKNNDINGHYRFDRLIELIHDKKLHFNDIKKDNKHRN